MSTKASDVYCIPCFLSTLQWSEFCKTDGCYFIFGYKLDFICHWEGLKINLFTLESLQTYRERAPRSHAVVRSGWEQELSDLWIGGTFSHFFHSLLRHPSCWNNRSTQWQWITGVLGLWCSSVSLVSDPFCQPGSLYPGTIYSRILI